MKQASLFEYYDKEISLNHFKFQNLKIKGIGSQSHNAFEIIFLKEGNLNYIIDDKIYNVKKNSLILTRPNKTHNINFNQNNYERYDILFNPDIVFPDVYNALPKDLDVLFLVNPSQITEIFDRIDFFCNNFKGDALKNIILNMIEELFYCIVASADTNYDEFSKNNYTTNSILTKSIEYIKQNLTEPICLESMCKELYISKSYLHKIFNQYLQTTPKKYIISKRLTLAQKLLRSKEKPTDVYLKCGFGDYSSFFRSYVQHFGYSPSKESDKRIIKITV